MLTILEFLFRLIVKFRNTLYDKNYLSSHDVGLPVVSVGNILVGGTGKTPLVDFLIDWAEKKSIKIGVILRGYKGSFKGLKEVHSKDIQKTSSYFGDEASLLSLKHPKTPIFIGKNRRKLIEKMKKKYDLQMILADDAFQHRSLKRDVDIVVINALSKKEDYSLLPLGRGREPLSSLKRASAIVLNRVNLISLEEKQKRLNFLKKELRSKTPIIECSPYIRSLIHLSTRKKLTCWDKKSVFLASGIGAPQSFFSLMQKRASKILGHKVYKDHHNFSLKDIQKIVTEAKTLKADLIVITEKDAVKFLKYSEWASYFWMSELKLKIDDSLNLTNKIHVLTHK